MDREGRGTNTSTDSPPNCIDTPRGAHRRIGISPRRLAERTKVDIAERPTPDLTTEAVLVAHAELETARHLVRSLSVRVRARVRSSTRFPACALDGKARVVASEKTRQETDSANSSLLSLRGRSRTRNEHFAALTRRRDTCRRRTRNWSVAPDCARRRRAGDDFDDCGAPTPCDRTAGTGTIIFDRRGAFFHRIFSNHIALSKPKSRIFSFSLIANHARRPHQRHSSERARMSDSYHHVVKGGLKLKGGGGLPTAGGVKKKKKKKKHKEVRPRATASTPHRRRDRRGRSARNLPPPCLTRPRPRPPRPTEGERGGGPRARRR